jgi:hypothetical protein
MSAEYIFSQCRQLYFPPILSLLLLRRRFWSNIAFLSTGGNLQIGARAETKRRTVIQLQIERERTAGGRGERRDYNAAMREASG